MTATVPNFLLACDPGRCTGWALFARGVLVGCGLARSNAPGGKTTELARDVLSEVEAGIDRLLPPEATIDFVVVEEMFYRPDDRRSVPEDLLQVAHIAGPLTALGDHFRWLSPREWKGQVPKAVTHTRMHRALSPTERETLGSQTKGLRESLCHNLFDAVAIGLFALNRLHSGQTNGG